MNAPSTELKSPLIKTYDKLILLLMVLILAIGALMIYSSTSVGPLITKKKITEFYYFKRHLFTMALGFCSLIMVYKMKLSHLKNMAVPLLVVSFILLILVFVPSIGIAAGGAKRWIRLWPTTFQPSELVKLAMVIYLARYMSTPGYDTDSFVSFLKPLGIMVLFQLVFIKQPDFGATVSLGLLTFGMIFISGMRLKYIGSVLLLAVPVIFKLIMEPYRLKRVTSFLDPSKDPLGSGFQLVQAFISLGSGGLTGLGLGESKQKLSFLPAAHTDFIFCLVGEELGLIGASVVVSLFLFLFIRGILIANRSGDRFVFYVAYGLTLMIAFQALINFAVVTGLVPTKGLPLPFMSYGGSALLVNMLAVGIIMKISRGDKESASTELKGLYARRRAMRNIYSRKGYKE